MKKSYTAILLSLLLYSTHLCAQESKMSIALSLYVKQCSLHPSRSVERMPVLVKGDVEKIRSYTLSHDGIFRYSIANKYASIVLPVSVIQDFAQSDFVKRVEGIYSLGRPMSDSVGCFQSRVLPVQNDSAPLTRSYLGDSVIVGIIDGYGFDFSHRDFEQPYDSTKTRFLYIWDQSSTAGNSPSGFGYGTQWDSTEINLGECTEVDNMNHGTNCLGAAAGNGLAFSPRKAYTGVAPRANIIGVKFLYDQYWLTRIVDAANYIYAKADSLNEPCVINLSWGTYQGSHDGQDLPTQMLDSLITEHKGHTFVTACGDEGGVPFHLGYAATSDSSFTWFDPSGIPEAFEFWVNADQVSNFNFAIGADDTANWSFRGRSPYYNISDWNGLPQNTGLGYTLKNKNNHVIFGDTVYMEQQGNAYHFFVYIGTDSTSYYIRFITQGSGRFDMWAGISTVGTWRILSHVFQKYLPTVSKFPDFVRYKYTDSLQTICSGFQCSPYVISVANYTNRVNWFECNGPFYTDTGVTQGALSATSSWGPTRDGRIEPDIAAPGDQTIAPGVPGLLSQLNPISPYKVAKGCVYNINGGTSLAAPFAAGVAALYLEKYPYATWKEVKAAIDSCAYKDNFTTATPISYEWGYGKVDAFCSIQHLPDDTTTAIKKPVAVLNNASLTSYPNPFNNYTNIVYSFGTTNFQFAEIDVSDMIGHKVSVIPLHNSSGSLQFNNNNLPQGMYIYRLVVDQKPLATGKFIILY